MAASKGVMAAKRAEINQRPERVLEFLKTGPQTSKTVMEFLGMRPTTSNKAALNALKMLKQHGLAVEIHLGDGQWWTVPGSAHEAQLIERMASSIARRAKRDRKAAKERMEREKAAKEALRRHMQAMKDEEERREAAWLYPTKRLVSDWQPIKLAPGAVRSVFDLAGV